MKKATASWLAAALQAERAYIAERGGAVATASAAGVLAGGADAAGAGGSL